MLSYSKMGKGDFFFLPLGGSDEIGMNLNLYCHDGNWIIVDCGITFNDKLGVEIITPDISVIKEKGIKVSAIIVTHAHEDHIGAIPYLWPELKCPVYATPFTASVIRNKINETSWSKHFDLREIPIGGSFKVESFDIEFSSVTHSIPESNAIIIRTDSGNVVHTGDWKIDPGPIIGQLTDIEKLKKIGNEGVIALVCDSTNIFCEGESVSEEVIASELEKLIKRYPKKRITLACFASNVARVETISKIAAKCNRKVSLIGISINNMVETASKSGYFSCSENLVELKNTVNLADDKILFISTGSQGEIRSGLAKIASDKHPLVRFGNNDVVIFSSRVIPGNEKVISDLQNRLILKNVEIITSKDHNVHVSGHPPKEDLKKMYEWVNPETLIPVHGEPMHLFEHSNFAKEQGIEKVLIPRNGTLIHLNAEDGPQIVDEFHSGRYYYDGNRLLSSNSPIFGNRNRLFRNGAIFISVTLSKSNQMLVSQQPRISLIGIEEYGEEYNKIVIKIQNYVMRSVKPSMKNHSEREGAIKLEIKRFFKKVMNKDPVVNVHFNVI